MAGVVPKKSTSGRKQWTLRGDPRCSLRRLRSQMASDGCPESQVVMAKQLLDQECEYEEDKKENAKQGVDWLIKASEHGNLEAVDLLKTCLKNGRGITKHNYLDVKSCISMTQEEKLARKAAREMFASLSNGGEFITSDQLQKKILAIDRGEMVSKSTETVPPSKMDIDEFEGEIVSESDDGEGEESDWSQESTSEKLTEDNLVSAAVDYTHGHLPVVSRALSLSDPDLKALDHVPFMHRSILHPLLALRIIYYKFINYLASKRFFSPFFLNPEQMLCLILIYVFLSADNLIFFIPLFIYYTTSLIMVCTTCKMLQNQRDFSEFRLWSGLFLCYSNNGLNAQQSELQYLKNNLKPYAHYFVSILVNFLIYPVISHEAIPHSEFTIIAFGLTFMTLVGFMQKRRGKIIFDPLILFSFAINVLAKYPYETDPIVAQGWRYLELKIPTFPSYVIGNGIEFCINFKLLLYCLIPIILLKIASQENWRGTYKYLIPHCVTLSWLQICIINSQGATMFGFLRGALALVGIVLFLPLAGLTSIFLPVIAVVKWFFTSDLLISALIVIILSLLSIAVCYFLAQTRLKKSVAVIQVFLIVFSFLALVNQMNFNMIEAEEKEELSWDAFQKFCHQPLLWQEENIAQLQIKCAELEGLTINWDGYIKDVKIKSIKNSLKTIIDLIPFSTLRQYFYCFYGPEIENDCQSLPDILQSDCLTFYSTLHYKNRCSLQHFNKYTLEITIKMTAGIWAKPTEVTLIVDDYFKNFTLRLKPNDQVAFKGVIFNAHGNPDGILGGFRPHVKLDEIQCLNCYNRIEPAQVQLKRNDLKNYLLSKFYISGKFLLNLVFNPIFVLK